MTRGGSTDEFSSYRGHSALLRGAHRGVWLSGFLDWETFLMGAYKDMLIGIQELIWTAIELGARDADSVYAYVYMYEPRVTESQVKDILEEMFGPNEQEYNQMLLDT